MPDKTEGQTVREAYDGPEFDHDQLIGQIEKQASDEYERASDAGESGARLKEFLDETGLNSQAFSWLKAIVKKLPKKDGQTKAMDIIRSLEMGLPMVKDHVAGQSTQEMDFDQDGAAETASEEDIAGDTADFEADAAKLDEGTVEPIDFGGAA